MLSMRVYFMICIIVVEKWKLNLKTVIMYVQISLVKLLYF